MVSNTVAQPANEGDICFGNNFGTGVCHNLTCQNGCMISQGTDLGAGGGFVTAGTFNPDNSCQYCQPSFNAFFWSTVPNGTACGGGKFCSFGLCGGSDLGL